MHNQLFSLEPTLPTSHLSPTYTYTACISFIPTYTYTACNSFIPHIYLQSLHLIYPPHIPTLPALHLFPTCTYIACTSFISHMYLQSLNLIYPPHIPTLSTLSAPHLSPTDTYRACIYPPHIPSLPASHLFPRFNS